MKRDNDSAMPDRYAIVHLSRQELEQLLQLPAGLRIVGVRDDWARIGVRIMVEGEALEPVDKRMEPPTLHGTWHYNTGTGTLRWEFPVDALKETSA